MVRVIIAGVAALLAPVMALQTLPIPISQLKQMVSNSTNDVERPLTIAE